MFELLPVRDKVVCAKSTVKTSLYSSLLTFLFDTNSTSLKRKRYLGEDFFSSFKNINSPSCINSASFFEVQLDCYEIFVFFLLFLKRVILVLINIYPISKKFVLNKIQKNKDQNYYFQNVFFTFFNRVRLTFSFGD